MTEKEYIEREKALDALFGQFCASSDETEAALNAAIEEIKAIPAADVRPVVLCRDCKHYEIDIGWCEYFDIERVFEDYCSEGKKREES